MSKTLRIATRGSPLALLQAERVAQILAAQYHAAQYQSAQHQSAQYQSAQHQFAQHQSARYDDWELVVVRTKGDHETGKPISSLGGEGVFVKEIQQAVLEDRADVAVHSAKDLPSSTPDGLVLACVPERADPRDAFVGRQHACTNWFEELPPGATVATGSPRRRAQLSWLRPDLTFTELRGNIATRIEKAEVIGAGLIAMAALERLGLTDSVTYVLEPSEMLPQVGQGALAVECRSGDDQVLELLAGADDTAAHRALVAERSWLAELGGGCNAPVAAYAEPDPKDANLLKLEGMIASHDGRIVLRRSAVGSDPEALGRDLALEMVNRCGATALDEWADCSRVK